MADSEKSSLLYVDDDEPNLFIFRALFMRRFNVLTASSPQEGLEILEANPDVKIVFSDLKMPKMDGMEFISAAREKHPGMSYVLVTGSDMSNELDDAMEKGLIDDCIHKPFEATAVEGIIEKFI